MNPLVADLLEALVVGAGLIYRVVVELKVGRMHDIPCRGIDKKSEVVGNIVVLPEGFHGERAELKLFAVFQGGNAEFGLGGKIFLAFENNGFSQVSCKDGWIAELAQQIGYSSDVVVVAMRN